MAYKTFISYKYSDSVDTRDRIIKALGDDAKYYKGEDGYSDNMSSLKAKTIRKKLSDMIYDTSITILILSEHMTESKWIDWEIGYSLRKETRNGRQSQPNIIIPVITPINGYDYNWADKDGSSSQRDKWNEIEKYIGTQLDKPFTEYEFIGRLNNEPTFFDYIVFIKSLFKEHK